MKGILFYWNSFSAIFIGSVSFIFSMNIGADLDIYNALVPITLAFSYFVKNGDVILSLFGFDLYSGCNITISFSSSISELFSWDSFSFSI